jgi:hypothetical protein
MQFIYFFLFILLLGLAVEDQNSQIGIKIVKSVSINCILVVNQVFVFWIKVIHLIILYTFYTL